MSGDWRPTAAWPALALRAELLAGTRRFFAARGVLEVETPCLAAAGVTDLHLESLQARDAAGAAVGYLQTSPEYAMKRLLAAGAPDMYQIARVFRGGESGRRHNGEFTLIEWYRRGLDHHGLMNEVEALLGHLLGPRLDLGPAGRVAYHAAVDAVLDLDSATAGAAELAAALALHGVDVPRSLAADCDALLDLVMSLLVAPGFAADRLTFVYDFPASQAALARRRGAVASRFEVFWGGLELANGFHELGDADEQAARFAADNAQRRQRGLPSMEPDARFLEALRTGLPDCAGVAVGFDRIVMVAAGAGSIDEVIAFPQRRA